MNGTSRRRRNRPPCGERGYVLLVIMALAAVLVVAVYRMAPNMVFDGRRQREEELIFRGEQYRRAIQLYVRKFGRYPTAVDDLLETNNTHFIRRLYKDPMTPEGEWRLIHIAPDNSFPDALVGPAPQQSSLGTLKLSATPGTSVTSSPAAVPAVNPAAQGTANPPGAQQPRGSGLNPGNTFGEGAIAGVASMSEKTSIRLWNNQSTYNMWEFIYDYRGDPQGLQRVGGPQQGQQGQPGQPGQQGQPNPPGQPGPGGQPNPLFGRPPGFSGIPQPGGPGFPAPGQQPPGGPNVPGQPGGPRRF